MVQLNFDARNVAPMDNDPPPEGWYDLIIDESGSAPTKDGNPNHLRLNLRFNIMTGPHQGRKVFTGLNIRHTNIQTMEIANRELSAICHAVNLPYVQDTQQLHGIPLKGRIKVVKDPTGQYDDRAEIKSYKPASFIPPGMAPSLAAGTPAPYAAPQAPTGWQGQPQAAPQAPGWGTATQQGQPNGQYAPPAPPPQQYAPPPPPPQQYAPQPQQYAPAPPPPQQPAPIPSWQQPQAQQPWGQPGQQAAPQPQHQTAPPPPVQYAEPQQQPPQQPGNGGFAAPTPPPQQMQQPTPPPNPAAQAAQQAAPPWVRQG